MNERSIVGDAINFRGMIYGPVNELGVVALFAQVCEETGFVIEEIRAYYPDCIARQQIKRGWERIYIEFEYRSSNFMRHGHDPARCDLIVCWEHDWPQSPLRVFSLKDYLTRGKNRRTDPGAASVTIAPAISRRTQLTSGGVKNGYINIKPLDDFWPDECRGGNVERALRLLNVEFEGGRRVMTDISRGHKNLRRVQRDVKRFIEAHGLRSGDWVEIVRLGKYEYRIRPPG